MNASEKQDEVTVPKITVVSYCHDAHAKWIPFWCKQIQNQTWKDFKILFIAHNWKDESRATAARLVLATQLGSDFDVNFMTHSGPPVIGDVIDFGCEQVDTEFFAHWDVDDMIHPERLRLQSEFLDANPDIDFLGTRMVGFYGEPHPEMLELNYYEPDEPNAQATNHEDIYRVLLKLGQNCLGHTTMIYRPEIMKALGGFSRSDVNLDGRSPDFETWKKALMAGHKFHRLPQLCALWRLDSSSIRHV